MSCWFRHSPFNADHLDEWVEQWEYKPLSGMEKTFHIRARAGKKLDVLSLKGTDLSEIEDYALRLKTTAEKLYRNFSIKKQRLSQL